MIMIEIKISYGKKILTVQVPEKNLLDYACMRHVPGVANEAEAITRAIKRPIEMESLEKLAAPGQKIAIIVDDITRPTSLSQGAATRPVSATIRRSAPYHIVSGFRNPSCGREVR
jgi:nickel-dependent lactate racemase